MIDLQDNDGNKEEHEERLGVTHHRYHNETGVCDAMNMLFKPVQTKHSLFLTIHECNSRKDTVIIGI